MADDIAALIDALELGRVRVIGHSMGGVNSWWLAALYPEQIERLVIVDVDPETISSNELTGSWIAALGTYAQSTYATPEDAVQEYLAGYTSSHQQELRAFVINNLKVDSEGRWTWRFDARGLVSWVEYASRHKEAHWSVLRQLACPVLLLRAGNSPFTKTAHAERMVREIPRALMVEIPGAGHDIHIDQYDAFLAELRPFLLASCG
jgi:pimeloyl-ACP methyl ester carboxylesterase